MADYVGAVDQGTTSTRFMIFDHDGAEVARSQLEHEQILPKSGWVEHNPVEIWERTSSTMSTALNKAGLEPSDLAAVGITNQRETTVVWNKNTGRPYYNAIVWQDTRTASIIAQLERDGHADVIKQRTGLQPAPYFAGSKIKWILDNVDGVREAAEKGEAIFGTTDSWVVWNLTGGRSGGRHVTDVTNASRTMLMDLEKLEWDDELLGFLDIPRAMLPEIVSSSDTEAFGTISRPSELEGVKITAALGDQHAAMVGQVCFEPGEGKNTYGTGNFLLLNTGKDIVHSEHGLLTTVCYRFGDEDPVYALEGSIAVTGSAVQWLRDQLGIISGASEIESLAKQVDDNGGVYFVPAFSGLFAPYWRSDARGAIVGLSRFNTNAHLARATLEAICYQSRDVADAMAADSGVTLDVLKVDGGVTANDLCMQMQADILNVPVSRPVVAETTALGAAYAAGLAVGFWSSTDEVRKHWHEDKRWDPQWSDEQREEWLRRVEEGRVPDVGLGRRRLDPEHADHKQCSPPNRRIPMQAVALSPEYRADALREMRDGPELDILVVGGGVVGAGSALDAATRGLRVGLIEARDWASGTSSRSSKLMHGGLRYLEMLDFALVREALKERGLSLGTLAPYLVQPVRFLYPLKHRIWERPYVGAGIALYDAMAATSGNRMGLPLHKHLSKRRALRVAPALREDSLVGAVQYSDAQVDDARHTMTIVRTAATYGALVANRTRVTEFERAGEHVIGARVKDLESGEEFVVHAKQVINATGVWTDDTQAMADTRGQFHVRASKGIHLVVPRDRLQLDTGLILRTEKSVLFVIPWGRHWIIGTTDTDWDLDKAHPAASSSDIEYVLGHVNSVLRSPLTAADVEGVYAGLRPLLSGESDSTSKLSREHVVGHPAPGLVVVAGGKYTTYRVMAKDAVDEAVRALDSKVPQSCTEQIPLVGADGWPAMWNIRHELAEDYNLNIVRVEHLLHRYGSMVKEVLAGIKADPSLAEALPGADDYLRAEVPYAVSHEGARHLDDVLARRTRTSIESWDRGVAAAPVVADLMAPLLGWGSEQIEREVSHYVARVEAERESQKQPDDATADAARLGAEDIVPIG